nr:NAD(+) diphosphatase [Endozoicomonas sp.]
MLFNQGNADNPEFISEIDYQPLSGFQSELTAQCWLVLYDGQIVVNDEDHYLWHSLDQFEALMSQPVMVTGYLHEQAVGIVVLSSLADGLQTTSIRSLLSVSDSTVYAHISHSLQILTSRKEHAFCGCCGHRKREKSGEWAMVCTGCGHPTYPRISPCVIVVVSRGEELLLVRHIRHGQQSTMHTLVAGYVEPGESAEAAVRREVFEETGLTLGDVNYCFSQSWPFPHSLMLGFHAEYKSGELVLEEKELCFGGWFHKDSLPELPPEFTISRQLVDYVL